MNFDWTAEDRDLKTRVAGLFDATARAELERMEHTQTEELRDVTGRYLRRLADIGYLSPGVGPSAFSQTLHLIAGQEELARASGSLFLAVETSVRLFGGLVKGFGQSAACKRDLRADLARRSHRRGSRDRAHGPGASGRFTDHWMVRRG